ncbi:hypothetical protein IWQ61_008640 [Dispira simplex]|nr:hypothetical protein IWQ61_008640 [Dispira simplex]
MNILVVGTGAVGSLLAYRLQDTGCNVTCVCRSNYETAKSQGFLLRSSKYGDVTYHPSQVVRTVDEAVVQGTHYDYILVCTKAFPSKVDTSRLIYPAVQEGTMIILVQNGIGVEDRVIEVFPHNPVIPAVIYVTTEQVDSGVIQNFGPVRMIVGCNQIPTLNNPERGTRFAQDQKTAGTFADLLNKADVATILTDNIQGYRWLKTVWNASFNTVSVVAGECNTHELLDDPALRELVIAMQREIWAIGTAVTGQPLPIMEKLETPEDIVKATREGQPPYKPSMLQDYLNHHPMEHEVILKNPITLAHRHHIPVPRCETVYAILHMLSRKQERADLENKVAVDIS